jgi:TetR/AcrR family transcriptional regulator
VVILEYKHSTELFEKISEEKQSKIFEAAMTEFAEHGYESANINNIAENAGVSIGSMYKYFINKEELYLTIVHFCVEKLKSILDGVICSEDTLTEKIEKIIRAIQVYSRSNFSLNKIYNQMTTEGHSELVWELVSGMEGVTAELYAELIEEAKESGEIRKDVDSKLFAFFLDNLFLQLQFSYSCEYYKERLKMFVGKDVFDNDELVASQLLKFIKGALFLK